MGKDLLIFGLGGAGRELAFSLSMERDPERAWRVAGHVTDLEDRWNETINGFPVLGGFEWLEKNGGSLAVSLVSDPREKQVLVERLKHLGGVDFPLVTAPGSYISEHIEWGEGCIVSLPFNCITTNIRVGDFVWINCGNGIGHDVEIGDYTTVYSHIDISGGVTIGSHCVIGSGVTINPRIKIGNDVIVGAGSVVVKDVPDNVTVAGVPAKVIREHGAG